MDVHMVDRQTRQAKHSNSSKKPAIQPQPAPNLLSDLSQSTTSESILYLQRMVGNYAVQQMIQNGTFSQTPKIQRKEIGLEQSELSDNFVDKGYAWWSSKGNKDKPASDYASHLIKLVNEELAKFDVHPTNHDFRTSGAVGAFRKSEWMIYFNSEKLKESGETVGDITQPEAAEIANTVYHEARHAEQAFRIARMLVGEGKAPEDIASDLPVPRVVAEKAALAPLKNTKDTAKEFAEAKDWYAVMGGIHRKYSRNITSYSTKAFDASLVIENTTDNNLDSSKQKVKEFMKELEDEIIPFIESETQRVKGISDPTDGDKNILEHLEKITTTSTDVIIQWVDSEAATNAAQLKMMERPMNQLWMSLFYAYKDLAAEKDAWEVGDEAGKKFENKQPEPVK